MITGYIYCLICPAKNEVIYIGGTTMDLQARMGGHMASAKTSLTPLYNYIREKNVVPLIKLLEEVPYNDLRKAEGKWIKSYRLAGHPLLNVITNTGLSTPSEGVYIGNFKSLPADIRSIILREEFKIKDEDVKAKTSMTKVIINIIREWEQLKSQ